VKISGPLSKLAPWLKPLVTPLAAVMHIVLEYTAFVSEMTGYNTKVSFIEKTKYRLQHSAFLRFYFHYFNNKK